MKKVTVPTVCRMILPPKEGEFIEEKVRRITENGEPIEDSAPIIYTERKDGVNPAYDIRTDRWDIALEAMNTVNSAKSKIVANKIAKTTNVNKDGSGETGGIENNINPN